MKIRFLKSAASVRFSYKKGGEYNLPASDAMSFVRSQLAEIVEEVIEQHELKYENAIQVSNKSNNVPIKPVRSKVTLKEPAGGRKHTGKRVNKKRN